MQVLPASTLPRSELLRVFNAGYSDYLVPLQLDRRSFDEHLDLHDVDLDCSMVLADPDPVAIALVARRGRAGWVAGVGTAPDRRRAGLGERALTAALRAAHERGCEHVDLEVLEGNDAAFALYEKLGFATVRDVLVWMLPATDAPPAGASTHPVTVAAAQEWIADRALTGDPWQRSCATAAAVLRHGGTLRAAAAARNGTLTAAVIWHERPGRAVVLQIAADDEQSAAEALLAASGGTRDVRLTNIEADDPASRASARLGARLVARQHEMRLRG